MGTELIKIKLSKGAKLPCYQSLGASGADLHAFIKTPRILAAAERSCIPTGLFLEIPQGYEIQVRPRSGLALRHGIMVVNSPGTIDSDYRGELQVLLFNGGKQSFVIEPGMRIAQIVLCPIVHMKFELCEQLSDSKRSSAGFGSTGSL